MSLDSMVQDASSGLFVPPQARRPVIPWDDLQALATPSTLSQISPDIISALAILVAQGKDKPRLLSVDAQGALVANSRINSLARFTDSFVGGSTLVPVDDTTGFYPGQSVSFASATGGPAACGGMTIESIPSLTSLRVFASCGGQNFVPGDFVIGKGQVTIDPTGTTIPVTGSVSISGTPNVNVTNLAEFIPVTGNVIEIGGVTGASVNETIWGTADNNGFTATLNDPRGLPCGFSAGMFFGGGVTPSITFAAVTNRALMVHAYRASLGTGVATAVAESVLINEVGSGGLTLWADSLAVPAVIDSGDTAGQSDLRIATRRNFGLTIVMNNALVAGQFATLAICGYII